MKQFEYKTLEFEPKGKWFKSIKMNSSELEVQLNDMGKNGWELVNSICHSLEGNTVKVILLFKKRNYKTEQLTLYINSILLYEITIS